MTASLDFIVNRANLRDGKFVTTQLPELKQGQVLLHVDKFALTANNITYGAAGDSIGYWKFFPASDGWGRIPVWGYADVVASKNEALPVGERVYGYLPISTHAIVDAAKITPMTFIDGAAHRAALPPVYNQYQRVGADQAYFAGHEDEIASVQAAILDLVPDRRFSCRKRFLWCAQRRAHERLEQDCVGPGPTPS